VSAEADSSKHTQPHVAKATSDGSRTVVIALSGELDSVTAPQAQTQVSDGFLERPERLVIDFSEVTFLASAGLAVLVYAHAEAERVGVQLSLTGVKDNRVVHRALEVTGLIAMFKFDDAKLRQTSC
jgi:anti-sigma B factor antagonist